MTKQSAVGPVDDFASMGVSPVGLDGQESLLIAEQDMMKLRRVHKHETPSDAPPPEPLIWTIGRGLGDDFTPEIALALAAIYDPMSGAMAVNQFDFPDATPESAPAPPEV